MPSMNRDPALEEVFALEQHGEVTVIVPSRLLETFDPSHLDEAAELILRPIRRAEPPLVIVDLGAVDYFGSSFLTLLLKCWRTVQPAGGQMALAGVSPRARELLHLTSLDIVWPIYTHRAEAIEALTSD